jgi:hypothetical protein
MTPPPISTPTQIETHRSIPPGSLIPVGIVLLRSLPLDVMLIVQLLRILLSVPVRLNTLVLIHALGLGQLVDLAADEAGEELLSESVGDRFAYRVKMGLLGIIGC